MMTPALRMTNAPPIKATSSFKGGIPRAARTNAHKVGKSNKYVPVWFGRRINLARADQGVTDETADEEATGADMLRP